MPLMLLLAFLMVPASTATAQTTMKTIPAPPDVAAPPADAAKTKSGLASRVIKAGTGKTHPGRTDLVTVHYTGWTTDGKMFDSSVTRGEPAKFPLDRVIAGWTEGVQLMVTGETRRLWIPEPLAYQGKRDPKGLLVFDVELISFVSPPQAPADVNAPPPDANKTPSGLAYKVQRPGGGSRHPTSNSEVTVHYTGWTTNGQMFDSSVTRGGPATFPLGQVIAGWTEGVQLMVEGEKTRFWIPENLAYKGQAGAPAGMLVFDVELIKIR
jgi:FKBP-type peptidyl-prolyl cis-trans isomerase